MMKLNEIYCQDCMKFLEGIDSERVDLIVTDPPYNYAKDYGKTSKDNLPKKEYLEWCKRWILECHRVLKSTECIYVKIAHKHSFKIANILEQIGFIYQNQIIWKNVPCFPAKTRYAPSYEVILFFTKSEDYQFNTYAEIVPSSARSWIPSKDKSLKGQLGDIWLDIKYVYTGVAQHPEAVLKGDGTKKKAHPCQMPTGLSDRAIKFSSKEGDLVVDPFIGTGTTAVSCKKLNRNFIGCDSNKEYVIISKKRLQQEIVQNFIKV